MTGEHGSEIAPPMAPDEDMRELLEDPDAMAWFEEHLTEMRRNASGQRILYWTLAITFVVGLAAHAIGYVLGSNPTTEPLGLFADLLYALGWALWTGVVVVVFVQIVPEAKRRQFRRALDAYESVRLEKARHKDDGET